MHIGHAHTDTDAKQNIDTPRKQNNRTHKQTKQKLATHKPQKQTKKQTNKQFKPRKHSNRTNHTYNATITRITVGQSRFKANGSSQNSIQNR